MIKKILVALLMFWMHASLAQEGRIQQLRNSLDALSADEPGLTEKLNVNVKETTLSSFLLAVSEVHKVNLSIAPSLSQVNIVNNFTDVSIADLLLFLCKEHNLTLEFTGNIIAVRPYEKPKEAIAEKVIEASYDASSDLLSVDLRQDRLYDALRRITDVSQKNIVFAPGLENQLLTAYIRNMPFDAALNKIAFANNLTVSKSRDNFYMLESLEGAIGSSVDAGGNNRLARPIRARKSNFYFQVADREKKLLDVDFENTPIANIVYDIGNELGIDMFISSPLEAAGNSTVKAKSITFDDLLAKLFESKTEFTTGNSQPGQGQNAQASADGFTYRKFGNVYYFGTKNQLVVRNITTIPLMHRSIQLMSDPTKDGRSAGRLNNSSSTSFTNYVSNSNSDIRNNSYSQQQTGSSSQSTAPSESILSIIPDEIKKDLDIKVDKELNSFIVNGPSANIERFESFVRYIDKAVPVVLIEVMLLEVGRSAVVETGIQAGIGDKPIQTRGSVFPSPEISFSSSTINKIIDHFDGFGSLNIGPVIPEFYLSIKAMEASGQLKVRSSPRLSTLNGHKAYLSIGETTYYVVTNQNYYGSQIPQASEIKNYLPIDAELSVSILPLVSGDGQITMDIKVIQSSFNGQKIDEDAPPGINSREFTSIIRVKDQDLVVLGGLEEKVKNDNGTGTPLLSRIPIIKWFFSSRKREDSKKKLTVLIKPMVIY